MADHTSFDVFLSRGYTNTISSIADAMMAQHVTSLSIGK
jgi:hypothetical protein